VSRPYQARFSEVLRALNIDEGFGGQLEFEPTVVPMTRAHGDLSHFGPVQSRSQAWFVGSMGAFAAEFSGAQVVAGPSGCWFGPIVNPGGTNVRVCFNTAEAGTLRQALLNCAQEDLCGPGVDVSTALLATSTDFGPFQYGTAAPMPRGTRVFGCTFAAGGIGVFVTQNAPVLFDEPVFIPPLRAITVIGQTANTAIEFRFRVMEAMAFYGRNGFGS